MGAWDKLTAVNRILRAGGENPVNTLSSTSGDALMAEAILDEVNYEIQLPGLADNTEEQTLTADVNGDITIADNVLHVQFLGTSAGPAFGTVRASNKFVVARGRNPTRLYNITDNTYDFTAGNTVRVRTVTGMNYDDLSFSQQVYIADEAARRYQQLIAGDPGADATLREIWMQSRARARAQDIRSRNASIFGRWSSRLPWRAAKQTTRGNWSY